MPPALIQHCSGPAKKQSRGSENVLHGFAACFLLDGKAVKVNGPAWTPKEKIEPGMC